MRSPLAIAAWHELKKGARDLRPSDPDEEFHEVRKRAKRPIHGRADRADTASSVQPLRRSLHSPDDPGSEHYSASTRTPSSPARRSNSQLAEHADDPGFVEAAGRLLDTQKNAARTARTEFFKVWDKLDRKKSRRWMKYRVESPAKA